MSNVYNVWICVEKIDEAKDDNGIDICVYKIAKFIQEDNATEFAREKSRNDDTPRDKEGFTIL